MKGKACPEIGGDQLTVLELDHAPFEVVMEAPALPALRTPRSTIVTSVVVVDRGVKGLLDDPAPSRAERFARGDDGADGEGPPGPQRVPRHEVRGGCIAVDGIRLKLHGAAHVLLDPIDVERFPDDERALRDLADHLGVEAHEPHVSGESGPSESSIQAAHEHLLPLWRHRPSQSMPGRAAREPLPEDLRSDDDPVVVRLNGPTIDRWDGLQVIGALDRSWSLAVAPQPIGRSESRPRHRPRSIEPATPGIPR
jgi:hypothetical protein